MFKHILLWIQIIILIDVSTLYAKDIPKTPVNLDKAWEVMYTADFWNNTRGGLRHDSTYMDNIDLIFSPITENIGLWPAGQFHVYVIGNNGSKKLSSEIVGDLQVASNIEAPRKWRLYEFWYEHKPTNSLNILGGIHDYNSEFNVTEYGQLFLNSSFGIAPNVSLNARPGIFPLAAPGLRAKWRLNDRHTWLSGVYDGDQDNADIAEHFPRFDFDREGGVLVVSEISRSLNTNNPDAVKIGIWYNTGKFSHVVNLDEVGESEQHYNNLGAYAIFDKTLFKNDDNQRLGLFLQAGGAPSNINLIDFYIGGGLNYQGLIPKRNDDSLGVAFAHASLSDKLDGAQEHVRHETTIELTYRAVVNEYFSLQPDLQWIINPGADPDLNNALVVGIRCELAL